MTPTTIDRPVEVRCPPWCAGHQGNYQGWEERADGSRFLRDHAEVSAHEVGGVAVALTQVQDARAGFLPPFIDLYVDEIGGGVARQLSAAQARDLAAALLSAADRLEANQ